MSKRGVAKQARRRKMRAPFHRTSLLVLVLAIAQTHAQTAGNSMAPLFYDVTQETTLQGTVAGLFAKAATGMLPGVHLMLSTPNGRIDVSLGPFALMGKGSLSVSGGQQVAVTGVMKTLQGRQVFVGRLVKAGDNTYAIRNLHGVPIPPKSHERANQEAPNVEIR